MDILDELLLPEHYRYLTAFKCFDAVVTSTFSYDLDPNYARYIREFEASWRDLGISITPKVHLLCEHLEEACEYYGFGMALLNKSAGEAILADFAKHYQGYAVKDQESDSYQKKLLPKATRSQDKQFQPHLGRFYAY